MVKITRYSLKSGVWVIHEKKKNLTSFCGTRFVLSEEETVLFFSYQLQHSISTKHMVEFSFYSRHFSGVYQVLNSYGFQLE